MDLPNIFWTLGQMAVLKTTILLKVLCCSRKIKINVLVARNQT